MSYLELTYDTPELHRNDSNKHDWKFEFQMNEFPVAFEIFKAVVFQQQRQGTDNVTLWIVDSTQRFALMYGQDLLRAMKQMQGSPIIPPGMFNGPSQ